MEEQHLDFLAIADLAKANPPFLAPSNKGAGVCSRWPQGNANTGLLQAMLQKPCKGAQQQMRLWDMLTRNPSRTLSAACIKIQQKLLHREKWNTSGSTNQCCILQHYFGSRQAALASSTSDRSLDLCTTWEMSDVPSSERHGWRFLLVPLSCNPPPHSSPCT